MFTFESLLFTSSSSDELSSEEEDDFEDEFGDDAFGEETPVNETNQFSLQVKSVLLKTTMPVDKNGSRLRC